MDLLMLVGILAVLALIVGLLSAQPRKQAESLFSQITSIAQATPTDPRAHAAILELFNHIDEDIRKQYSKKLYNLSLSILSFRQVSADCRLFVLDTGRLHYSLHNRSGRVTGDNEQAIQNDILVRTQSATSSSNGNPQLPALPSTGY